MLSRQDHLLRLEAFGFGRLELGEAVVVLLLEGFDGGMEFCFGRGNRSAVLDIWNGDEKAEKGECER